MRPHKQKGVSHRQPLTYDSLNRGKREIRLATLLPGAWRARIRCNMTNVSLGDLPDYEALSYVCGSSKHPAPIFVNYVFHVAINLWYA